MSDSLSSMPDPDSRPDRSMWLVVAGIMLGLVVFVWLVLSLLPDSSGGGDSADTTPATPPPIEVPVDPAIAVPQTPPAPPVTPPAQGTTERARERALVERFPLGERQLHDRTNDNRRAAFGEIGSHCFADEVCGDVPEGAENLNDSIAGRGGGLLGGGIGGTNSGTGGGSSGSTGGGGSGAGGSGSGGLGSGGLPSIGTPSIPQVGGGLLEGIRDDAAEREAAKRAAQDAARVPVGQRGPHCFVGEICPPIPAGGSGGSGTRVRTVRGPTVPCGTLGVHHRVGEVQTCIDGVGRRVGTVPDHTVGTVPVTGGVLPPGVVVLPGTAPGFQVGGRCFQVIGQSGVTWTVRAIACPA